MGNCGHFTIKVLYTFYLWPHFQERREHPGRKTVGVGGGDYPLVRQTSVPCYLSEPGSPKGKKLV